MSTYHDNVRFRSENAHLLRQAAAEQKRLKNRGKAAATKAARAQARKLYRERFLEFKQRLERD